LRLIAAFLIIFSKSGIFPSKSSNNSCLEDIMCLQMDWVYLRAVLTRGGQLNAFTNNAVK